MNDALGTYLNNLVTCSGNPRGRVSVLIISDNARKMQDCDFDGDAPGRTRGMRRSSSTPLNHMASRWESASSFDSKICGTSPVRSKPTLPREKASRWESETTSGLAPKLTRPRREMDADLSFLSPVHDTGKLRNKHSMGTFKNMTKTDHSTASLPKSLRSLPY